MMACFVPIGEKLYINQPKIAKTKEKTSTNLRDTFSLNFFVFYGGKKVVKGLLKDFYLHAHSLDGALLDFCPRLDYIHNM